MVPLPTERKIRNRPSARQLVPEYGIDWSVSFKYLDPESVWLDENGSVGNLLLIWLSNLAKSRDYGQLLDFTLEQLNAPIHHAITYESLTRKGKARIEELLNIEEYVDLGLEDLFSLRYCHKSHSKERLIGVFRRNIFYPIWWDPIHEYCGVAKERSISGDCKASECLHFIDY